MVFNKCLCKSLNGQKRHYCDMYEEKDQRRQIFRRRIALEKKLSIGKRCWQIAGKDSVERIDIAVSRWLTQFICKFLCFFSVKRSITNINFPLVNTSKLKLYANLSLLIIKVWKFLLAQYTGVWKLQIVILPWHGISLK